MHIFWRLRTSKARCTPLATLFSSNSSHNVLINCVQNKKRKIPCTHAIFHIDSVSFIRYWWNSKIAWIKSNSISTCHTEIYSAVFFHSIFIDLFRIQIQISFQIRFMQNGMESLSVVSHSHSHTNILCHPYLRIWLVWTSHTVQPRRTREKQQQKYRRIMNFFHSSSFDT